MLEKLLQAATVTFLLELLLGIVVLSGNSDRAFDRNSQQPPYQVGHAITFQPAVDLYKFPTPLVSNMTIPSNSK